MRHLLTLAALAATVAFAVPANAQEVPEAVLVQKLCGDMTYNQIEAKLVEVMETHDFSDDKAEANMQAANLVCGYKIGLVENDSTPASLEFNRTLPYFAQHNGPPPRGGFRMPRPKMHPHHHAMRPHARRYPPPPPGGYGYGRPLKRYGYAPPRRPYYGPRGMGRPPVAGGYPQGYGGRRQGGYYGGEQRVVGGPGVVTRKTVEHPFADPTGQYRCWDATGEPSGGPGTGDSYCRVPRE